MMIQKMHTLFKRGCRWLFLLALAGGTGTACTDDFDSRDGDDSGGIARLSVRLPKVEAGSDSQVTSAWFIAFDAGGSGTSGALQLNTRITSSTGQVTMPVGKSNIFIIANDEEDALGLSGIKTEAELKTKMASWEKMKTQPYLMEGSYRNMSIGTDGKVKNSDGTVITLGTDLQRLTAKLTVNLQYKTMGGKDLKIDSVTVANRPLSAALLPQAFSGSNYVSASEEKKITFTSADSITTDGFSMYKPVDFFLSEYIVDADHAASSTCLYIHTHVEGGNSMSYPVYIGDWFGQGYTYQDFLDAATPAQLVGVLGLSVTRNKHYTLTCRLKGEEPSGVTVTTSVKEWEVENINGDINPGSPYFNVATTDVMVNPLKVAGTPLPYATNVNIQDIKVTITDDPENRFSAIVKENFIYFIYNKAALSLSNLTTEAGLPVTATATITVTSGATVIHKTVKVGVFNPISRFYVRGGGDNIDYSTVTPYAAGADLTAWEIDWVRAMGYNNPYTGAVSGLTGESPYTHLMGDVPADATTGCAGYWERSVNDRNFGRGLWRLPSAEGESPEESEAGRLNLLLEHLEPGRLNFDPVAPQIYAWTATEVSATAATAFKQNSVSYDSQEKGTGITAMARCIRDYDNTTTGGGASYLNISHNEYEIGPLMFRTTSGVVPIRFESDGIVTISLLDEDGNDISYPYLHIPFIGYAAATEDALFAETDPPVIFPGSNSSGVSFKDGYFCLHSTALHNLSTGKDDVEIDPMMPSQVRERSFSLLFRAGNLSKLVPIKFVETLASKDLNEKMTLLEAMGVTEQYNGYDYKLKQYLKEPLSNAISMPIPEVNTGCAAYYEGSSTDTKTGVGTWFVTETASKIRDAYNRNFNYWRYDKNWIAGDQSAEDFRTIYGDAANFLFETPESWASYWTAVVANDPLYGTTFLPGYGSILGTSLKSGANYVRCERRLNADILTLSKQTFNLSPGASEELIYFTDAEKIADVGSENILYVSGTNPAFTTTTTTTTTNSGRIKVTCLNTATSGSEANLLIHTVGKTKRSETYKIIKLKVK